MGMFDNQNKQQSSQGSVGYNDPAPAGATPFDAVGSSTPNEGGVYPVPGVYPVLFCDVLKMTQSRKREDLFIAEFDILESQVEERRAGTRMSWVVNFKHDAAPGNVKLFLAALLDIPPGEVDAEGAKYACSAENPCHGRLIRLEATNTITKAGNDFTLCKWRSLPKEKQDQSTDLRAQAGFTPF